MADLGLVADGQPTEPAGRLGEPAQAVGPQQDPGRQKAQNGTDLEPVEQGHDNPGRRQKDHQVPILAAVSLAHESSVAATVTQAITIWR
ncbi:hypothetical protein D3C72_1031900 [compost metagenome]